MDLNEILVFTRVVQQGSFTAAAREMEMPKSTVSRKISELEDRLGARLLQRTTRRLHLTDVGESYFQHCKRIITEIEDAEAAVTEMQATPQGLLRVSTPLNFWFLGEIVAGFLGRYPDVRVELEATDRLVDLVEENFDVAIRAGPLADSTLIARKLADALAYMVASPRYLDERGAPSSPEALVDHDCVVFGAGSQGSRWVLAKGRKRVEVSVTGRVRANEFEVLRASVVAGLGIGVMPAFLCCSDLAAGRLVRVLPEWERAGSPIHAVYPSTRHLSPKVKGFLEFLQAAMDPPPWEMHC